MAFSLDDTSIMRLLRHPDSHRDFLVMTPIRGCDVTARVVACPELVEGWQSLQFGPLYNEIASVTVFPRNDAVLRIKNKAPFRHCEEF